MTNISSRSGPTILLIDDGQSLTYLIHRYGAACHCQVTSVQTIDIAQVVIKQSLPALIVVHITSLRLDHWAVVRMLKANMITSNLPIVLVCATSLEAAEGRELGANYCLMKPVLYDDFRSVLVASGTITPSL